MKSYFYLLVGVHGLYISDSPCISVPSVSIVSISVAFQNRCQCLFVNVLETKTGESISLLSLRQGVACCWDVGTVGVVFW
jgi:hypothetical protein